MESDDTKINEYEATLRKALKRIKGLVATVDSYSEPIAVVGMGCRYPGGANSPEEFWHVLESGVDGICEVPKTRFNVDEYYDPKYDVAGKMYTRSGGFLNVPVDMFDAEFFGISPKEAQDMDPQQRLLLEVTWEALEHAAIPPEQLSGSITGIYVGMMYSDYSQLILTSQGTEGMSAYYGSGNAFSAAVGRISYFLGLHGPCLAIDTACSSSLVAINSACESLRLGHCEQAIAGGVSLMMAPGSFIGACQAHMLSPDGHCKTFDKSADGYARAEGCGMIVLKRLSDAQRDGDTIYALIKGVGVNQGGATSGLTVPNGKAQEALIRQVLKEVGLKADDIDYVEAHGTGTSLGDPIEVRAIGAVHHDRDPSNPLLLGSAKSNIGHTESAAGVAGVIKMILALNHEALPGNLSFNELNPNIKLDFPVSILTKITPWPSNQRIRRAGVSSFGFSGTNAHLIIEEAPKVEPQSSELVERPLYLLTLSAKSEAALETLISNYQDFLNHTTAKLADICYSANTGRNHERFRMAVIAKDLNDLKSKMKTHLFLQGSGIDNKSYEIPEVGTISNWGIFLSDLANAYIDGAHINWNTLDSHHSRKKIALPTYPFQRTPFWGIEAKKTTAQKIRGEIINPLLGARIDSAAKEIVFEQIISLDEFPYLAGHVVYDSIILPGAGFIELMEAALFHLVNGSCELKEVHIEKPLLFEQGKQYSVQVIAKPEDMGFSFSVYSKKEDVKDAPWIRHAVASGDSLQKTNQSTAIAPKRLQQIVELITESSVTNYYKIFGTLGYQYGPDFQGLKGIVEYEGEHWGFVVAPDSLNLEHYLFHPALLDITFHALIAASLEAYKEDPYLPISFDSVVYYKPFGSKVWIKIEPKASGSSELLTADCIFYNELGECCASITGLISKKATQESLKKLFSEEQEKNWLYNTVWQEKVVSSSIKSRPQQETCLVLSTLNEALIQNLKKLLPCESFIIDITRPLSTDIVKLIHSKKYSEIVLLIQSFETDPPTEPSLEKNGILFLLSLAQAMSTQPELAIYLFHHNNVLSSELYNSFCRSWRLEEPSRIIKYVTIQSREFLAPEILIQELGSDNLDNEIRYQDGLRSVSRLQHLSKDTDISALKLLAEATYIITGGLGGLGLTLAKWCVHHGAKHLVLCGRSAPNEEVQNAINELTAEGIQIDVKSVNMSNNESVQALITSSNQEDYPLKGIFHLAGVVSQGYISDQTPDSFKEAFAAKASGAWYLHQATSTLALDYFILFSSISSALGAPGASNYSVANAFLDSLALYRQKQGVTASSIQWGPWSEVGMMKQLSEEKQIPGFVQMPPAYALASMEQVLLKQKAPNTLIADIDWSKLPKRMPTQPLWESFIPKEKKDSDELINRLLALEADDRPDYLKLYLRRIVQGILNMDSIPLDLDERSFSELGMDSLMMADLYNQLNEGAGKESKLNYTIAYDHPTINRLSEFLMMVLIQ